MKGCEKRPLRQLRPGKKAKDALAVRWFGGGMNHTLPTKPNHFKPQKSAFFAAFGAFLHQYTDKKRTVDRDTLIGNWPF